MKKTAKEFLTEIASEIEAKLGEEITARDSEIKAKAEEAYRETYKAETLKIKEIIAEQYSKAIEYLTIVAEGENQASDLEQIVKQKSTETIATEEAVQPVPHIL